MPVVQHDSRNHGAEDQNHHQQDDFAAREERRGHPLRVSARQEVVDEFRDSPEDDQDRPELANDAPGMDVGVEVLVEEEESDADQRQRPEDRSATVSVSAHLWSLYTPKREIVRRG